MLVEEDDDTQSFYSMLPESLDDEPQARHWSEECTQLSLLCSTSAQVEDVVDSWVKDSYSSDAQSTTTEESSSTPPPVPAIPERFRDAGKETVVQQRHSAEVNAHKILQTRLKKEPSYASIPPRPSTSGGEKASARRHDTIGGGTSHSRRKSRSKSVSSVTSNAREDALSKLEGRSKGGKMYRGADGRGEDLFLELANDQETTEQILRPTSRDRPSESRLSFHNKRRSLPVDHTSSPAVDRRPKSSGNVFGRHTTSRLGTSNNLQNHVDRYRSTLDRPSTRVDDAVSVSSMSRSGLPFRSTTIPERSSNLVQEQVRSPELPQFGRRRPSFASSARQGPKSRQTQLAGQLQDAYHHSPADSSEPKRSQPDSASVDSDTADTVWDELDDLKSRIKKLELTGKLPQTSAAAVSVEHSDRPRTATTAPTTIESSPKHDEAEHAEKPIAKVDSASPELPAEYVIGGPDAVNIHPNLHAALIRAKSLLNASLYRTLEATAADALQLAAMTGSAGPQGTAMTAAAIINGVTVSDRHVRRKADTMCRNLTDLVLALCDGKSESPSMVSSPVILHTPAANSSPSIRYSRTSLDPSDTIVRNRSRPISRLEARRTSILGSQAGSSIGHSPLESGEDVSASEQESTTSYPRPQQDPSRLGRSVSRLQAARQRRDDELGDDEDPTIRPVSRAATDVGRLRSTGRREFSTPQRSPGFRESIAARRVSQEGSRTLSRITSATSDSGGRRRFLDPNTPPVREEEGDQEDQQSVSQASRRVTSFGAYTSRRSGVDMASRASSLHQRRQLMVE